MCSMDNMTPKRRAILAFIRERITDHSQPPSLADIAERFGFASRSVARKHISALCQGGYIDVTPNQARGIRLAEPLRESAESPSAGDELILYQVLLGSWPLEPNPDLEAYQQRLWQWQQKALREAKLQSSWSAPNDAYEHGVEGFLKRLLLSEAGAPLRSALDSAAQTIAPAGALNGLAQTLLHLTVPGVPDVYQGDEFWDFSLVDPDNRRPVDFNARQRALDTPPDIGELLFNWRDGRIKQALIAQVLGLRKACPELFRDGSYIPLEVVGKHAERVVAFYREHHGRQLLVVVPRWPYHLLENGMFPQVNAQVWGDTRVKLPFAATTQNWKGLFQTGAVTPNKELLISTALGDLPVNVFINPDNQES